MCGLQQSRPWLQGEAGALPSPLPAAEFMISSAAAGIVNGPGSWVKRCGRRERGGGRKREKSERKEERNGVSEEIRSKEEWEIGKDMENGKCCERKR